MFQHPGRPDHHRSLRERQWLQILYQARIGPNIVSRASRLFLLVGRGHDRNHTRDPVSGHPRGATPLATGFGWRGNHYRSSRGRRLGRRRAASAGAKHRSRHGRQHCLSVRIRIGNRPCTEECINAELSAARCFNRPNGIAILVAYVAGIALTCGVSKSYLAHVLRNEAEAFRSNPAYAISAPFRLQVPVACSVPAGTTFRRPCGPGAARTMAGSDSFFRAIGLRIAALDMLANAGSRPRMDGGSMTHSRLQAETVPLRGSPPCAACTRTALDRARDRRQGTWRLTHDQAGNSERVRGSRRHDRPLSAVKSIIYPQLAEPHSSGRQPKARLDKAVQGSFLADCTCLTPVARLETTSSSH